MAAYPSGQRTIETRATDDLDFGSLQVLGPCGLGNGEIPQALVIGHFAATTDQTRSDR
jgi:hypothetical protein